MFSHSDSVAPENHLDSSEVNENSKASAVYVDRIIDGNADQSVNGDSSNRQLPHIPDSCDGDVPNRSTESMAKGISTLLTAVIRDFDSKAEDAARSQDQVSSAIDRLTRELDQLLADAPLPFVMQHAAKISSVRKRVSSLNAVLKSIQHRLDNIDRMLPMGPPPDVYRPFFLSMILEEMLYGPTHLQSSMIKKIGSADKNMAAECKLAGKLYGSSVRNSNPRIKHEIIDWTRTQSNLCAIIFHLINLCSEVITVDVNGIG